MVKMIMIFITFSLNNTLQHHGVCLQNGLGMETMFLWVVVSRFGGCTQFPEHI